MLCLWRVGSGVDSRRAHNPKVAGSNPAPATIDDEGLADARAANPFPVPGLGARLPRLSTGDASFFRPGLSVCVGQAFIPPSTVRFAPVMYEDSGPATNATNAATSSTCP